jgi:predicted phosphodiesterase
MIDLNDNMQPQYIESGSRVFTEECLNGGNINKKKYRHYADLKRFFGDVPVEKIIAMSDMHSITNNVIDTLVKKGNIDKKTIVICTGDMAGTGRLGAPGDANPYDSYVKILNACYLFYFVQGNHDIYDQRVFSLINTDGTPCCVHNQIIKTPIGIISGVNGISSSNVDEMRHKYDSKKYNDWIDRHRKNTDIDIFLTHMPIKYEFARIHMFGHAHNDKYYQQRGNSICLNMDSRVIMFC